MNSELMNDSSETDPPDGDDDAKAASVQEGQSKVRGGQSKVRGGPSKVRGGPSEPAAATPAGHSDNLIVWPIVITVVVMWFTLILPGKVAPLTKLHFVSLQFAPILGVVGLSAWWLTRRRVSVGKRIAGWLAAVVLFVIVMFAVHPSMRILMLVSGLPAAMTLLVLGVVLGRWLRPRKQAWFGLAAFALLLVAATLVRVGTIDAAFDYTLVPRWRPTAEQQMLRALAETSLAESTSGETAGDGVASSIDDAGPGSAPAGTDAAATTPATSPATTPATLLASAMQLPETLSADDWAEFRGPGRDGVVPEIQFAVDWESSPPTELWRRAVGPAWSSLCVVGPWLFTQEQRGQREIVAAYQATTGQAVWTQSHRSRFEASMGGVGPRATPTYHQQRLYVMGGSGLLQCLDTRTGKVIWNVDLAEQLGVPLPAWGFASSPLIVGDQVVVFTGGDKQNATVAFDRNDGSPRWSAAGGNHGYSSPQRATIGGTDQLLISSNLGLQSLDPASGQQLWNHPWDIGTMARVTQPTVVGDSVYLGTGYGNGTRRIDVSQDDGRWRAEEIWTNNLKPYFNDCVYHKGHLYGFDGPIFMCVDADSGDRAWKRGRYGHGQVLLVQAMDMLLIVTERGKVVLAEANPENLREVAKMDAVQGITWNHPVIAGQKLFIRNANEMVAYQLDAP